MEFDDVVRRRRMVRRYTDEPVDPDALDRIVAAARRAPSAGFSQGQRFIVVTDQTTRHAVALAGNEPAYVERGFAPWLSVAPVHIVICIDKSAYLRRYAETDKATSRLSGQGASEWVVPYWWVDAGASLMAILYAAVNENLAAGFLGAHAFDDLKTVLAIPGDIDVMGVVTIGHPDDDSQPTNAMRNPASASEMIMRDRWK